MNLLLFEPNEIRSDNTVRLRGRRSKHIVKVLGCREGDTIRAGRINGPVGTGEVLTISGEGENVEVVLRFTAEADPPGS
ncbi:MAG: 16S rRNA (uracil(1498)-N(3))-methyltransferase, partial [Desulfobulbales bacterium]|nr:16S rRNA (uracil(1498)-N(3))-methyltransferase [Desulfobulbales bacterium]